jgi:RNA polymerase sigma-70 factor (ECF subfamily)
MNPVCAWPTDETSGLDTRMPSVHFAASTQLVLLEEPGSVGRAAADRLRAYLFVTPSWTSWRDTTQLVSDPDRPRLPSLDVVASAASMAMERYAAGDDLAFEEVYDALAPRLYAFVLRRTQGNRARAEDLVQQTFLQMHHARGRFTPGADVVPWAYSIARRLLIDSVRRGTREVIAEDSVFDREVAPLASADDLIVAKEMAILVEAELARMPPAQREAFDLVKSEGMSMAEAAEALGTTVTAVKLRAHRAYEAIRVVLGGGPPRTPSVSRSRARAALEVDDPEPEVASSETAPAGPDDDDAKAGAR